MMYIILSDINYLIKQKYKIILTYLFIFYLLYILLVIVNDINDPTYFEYCISNIFGLDFNFTNLNDIFKIGMLILNYVFYLYLNLSLVINDLDNFNNLFPRIKVSKWLNTKIISSFCITLILNLIIYILPLFFGSVNIDFSLIVIKKVFIIMIITLYIYLLFLMYSKNRILFIFLCLLLTGFILFHIDIRALNMLYLLLVYISLKIIFIFFSKFIKFSDLER